MFISEQFFLVSCLFYSLQECVLRESEWADCWVECVQYAAHVSHTARGRLRSKISILHRPVSMVL